MSNYDPSEEQKFQDIARQVARDEVYRALSSPIDYPAELKSWVPQYVAIAGLQLPRADIIGAYTSGSTVDNLGDPVHGRPCTVRAGSSPYEFVQMTFDEVYGKWVSSSVWFTFQVGTVLVNVGSYTDLIGTEMGRIRIPNFKDLYNAGLRPQIATSARIKCANSGYTVYMRASIREQDNNDTALGTTLATVAELSHTGDTNDTFKFSAWTDPTLTAPTAQHAYFLAQKNATTPNVGNTLSDMNVAFRWVADPA